MLFQVHFLALLLEERGAGSLAQVAEHVRQKLIRRHPHVFGDAEVADAAEVLRNWDAIKQTEDGREPGIFGEVPENLPGPLYARKVQRRAASTGFDFEHVPYDAVAGELEELERGDRRATSASTRSATCCSPPSTWRASSRSTRSSRCAPRLTGFAAASRPPRRSPGPRASDWDELSPEPSCPTTHRRGSNEQ